MSVSQKSIWNRGNTLHPQINKPFAKDSTLLEIIERNEKLALGKPHFEGGDGAPLDSLFKLQRIALHMERQKYEGGNDSFDALAADLEEIEDLLNEPSAVDEDEKLNVTVNDEDDSGDSVVSIS